MMDRLPTLIRNILTIVLSIRMICLVLSLLVNRTPQKGLVDIGSSTLGNYISVPKQTIIHHQDNQEFRNNISLHDIAMAKKVSDKYIKEMYLKIKEINHSLTNLEINIERKERQYRFLLTLLEIRRRIHVSLIYMLGHIMGFEIFRSD